MRSTAAAALLLLGSMGCTFSHDGPFGPAPAAAPPIASPAASQAASEEPGEMLLRWVQPDDTSSFRVSVWSGTLGGGVSEAVYASGMAECGSESTGTGTVWCLEVPAPAGCRALWTVEAVNGAESTWAENGPRTRRCVATCAADLDWSGFVGLSDFNALGAAWGLSCE